MLKFLSRLNHKLNVFLGCDTYQRGLVMTYVKVKLGLTLFVCSLSFGFYIGINLELPSKQVVTLIAECESKLKRDQHCKIIAIPEVTE